MVEDLLLELGFDVLDFGVRELGAEMIDVCRAFGILGCKLMVLLWRTNKNLSRFNVFLGLSFNF
ncbi:hypothetical protein NIES208_16265 [[Limnothrix rosea] IAM M-220]|nr:hypothetical protein NIES208_16265 [[Limnothrix rosea] IAM M-220]